MLLTQEEIIARLATRLDGANRIDIAVAWASPGAALDCVIRFAKKNAGRLRSIVGISGNSTHPEALRDLHKFGQLRIPEDSPLFHPKVFLFHGRRGTVVWV